MTTTLSQLLEDSTRRFPERPALRTERGPTSYGELDEAIERLARVLFALGRAGRRTGLLLPNLPAFPVALHALFRIGGSALLLNPASSRRELAEQLDDAGVDAVLTTERLAPALPTEATRILLDADGVPVVGPGGRADRSRGAPPPGADDEAVVIFTAAMGGRARGAVLTHRNLVANLRGTITAMRLRDDDTVYGALPYAHAFGLTVCLNAPLALGAAALPVPRFSATGALDSLGEMGVSVLPGVPAMFHGLLGAAQKRGAPQHSLRVTLCGGAPLPLQLARDWEATFGLPLRQGYGLTEAAPVCLFNRVDLENRIGTMGEALPGVEISIRGPGGEELTDGEVGELHVRGENVFGGYLEPAQGAAASPGAADPLVDGWLRTGDLASREAGTLRFRGTVKSMFTRNGFNIYPEEIRRALLADARIADVRVFGRADPVREYDIVLEIEPAAGAAIDEEIVRHACTERLALYKQPSEIRILT